jgi:hypothetical protein
MLLHLGMSERNSNLKPSNVWWLIEPKVVLFKPTLMNHHHWNYLFFQIEPWCHIKAIDIQQSLSFHIWCFFDVYLNIIPLLHHKTFSSWNIFTIDYIFLQLFFKKKSFVHIKWLYPLLLKWFLNYVFFTIKTMVINEDGVFLACILIFLGNVVQMLYKCA